jgi:hypothetical protein
MKATKEPLVPVVAPKGILKGKDGREPFADKIEEAKRFLERVGLPDEIKKP